MRTSIAYLKIYETQLHCVRVHNQGSIQTMGLKETRHNKFFWLIYKEHNNKQNEGLAISQCKHTAPSECHILGYTA